MSATSVYSTIQHPNGIKQTNYSSKIIPKLYVAPVIPPTYLSNL